MATEEELIHLQEENRVPREVLAQRDEQVNQMQGQITRLSEQVQALQDRLAEDSHNSHLPPLSDGFVHKPKSLRKKSEKKAGGQPGYPGSTLQWPSTPDEVALQPVERCEARQQDLRAVASCGGERRQVVDVPPAHMIVREYQAEHKQCLQCHYISVASFPKEADAPLQYGPTIGAIAMYLTQQLLPPARACEVMGDQLRVQMSDGPVGDLIRRCAG